MYGKISEHLGGGGGSSVCGGGGSVCGGGGGGGGLFILCDKYLGYLIYINYSSSNSYFYLWSISSLYIYIIAVVIAAAVVKVQLKDSHHIQSSKVTWLFLEFLVGFFLNNISNFADEQRIKHVKIFFRVYYTLSYMVW